MCPIVGLAKILLILNGVPKFQPLVKNYLFTSSLISDDLIALDRCKVLGDKIPDIT